MNKSNILIPVFFAIVSFTATAISAEVADLSYFQRPSVSIENARLTSDDFEELLKTAYVLYTQKKYDEALAICVKAAKERPTDNRPYAISGIVYMAQWKLKSASDALAKAISFSPSNKRLYLLKATADRNRNAKDESIAASRKAIELDPLYAEAYAMLGEALSIGNSNPNEVIEIYRTSIKLKPELLTTYRLLGMKLSEAKDKKGAEEIYRKAMEIDPKKMACRFNLGRLLVEQGRLTEARAVWDGKTSDTDNTFPNLITILERAEKLKQVTADLAQKPNDPEALLEMGLIVMDGESWVVDGRQERAIEYFRKALAVKPTFAKAQGAIVRAYIQIADTDKDKNKNVDEEMAKLRKLDLKLADEITQYRKSYSGGLQAAPGTLNQ